MKKTKDSRMAVEVIYRHQAARRARNERVKVEQRSARGGDGADLLLVGPVPRLLSCLHLLLKLLCYLVLLRPPLLVHLLKLRTSPTDCHEQMPLSHAL